jgi:hypothetical protein
VRTSTESERDFGALAQHVHMRRIIETLSWTYKFGFVNLVNRFRNSRGLWELKNSYTVLGEGTSISDSSFVPDYAATFDLAACDEVYFKNFRRSISIIGVIDVVSIDQGFEYIREIKKFQEWKNSYKTTIEAVDSIGNPRTFKFGKYGTFSPTLIRYLKVHLDLTRLFGDLSSLSVSEIGIGFGGQASLIDKLGGYKSYNFFDLPPVLKLAQKFLDSTGCSRINQFHDGRDPITIESDLVVSNYAFSELARDIQIKYLERVILRAKRGYITWNPLSSILLNGFSLAELVRMIPNSEIMEESPYTGNGNVILFWGQENTYKF